VSVTDSYEHDDYCYLVTRGNPSSTAAAGGEGPRPGVSPATKAMTAGTVVPRDEILIAVYQTPGSRYHKGSDQERSGPGGKPAIRSIREGPESLVIGTSGAHQG
jgi:hypothetical protein